MNRNEPSLSQQLLTHATNSWMAQALYVAAELRLADLLEENPKSSEELAALTNTHAPSLYRLLRALGTIGVCRERESHFFEITPLGALLGSNAPESLRHWIIWWGTNLWQTWANLLYSVKTGESARKLVSGSDGFRHLEEDPRAAEVFNNGILELTRLNTENIIGSYNFAQFDEVADLGGGYGGMLLSILREAPMMHGILFDLPHAIDKARERFEKAGLAERCRFVAGDFFESIPENADAYLLKSILHDWDDTRGRQILDNCRRAMKKTARLLVIEQIIPEQFGTTGVHQALARSDLTMLVALAAQERTEKEFALLLENGGFRVRHIFPTPSTFSIIEAVAV